MLLVLLCIGCSISYGQIDTTYAIDEVEISHDEEKSVSESTQATSVFTSKDVKIYGATTAADVLQTDPGVQIKDYGGVGGIKTISVRNLSASHNLVLWNNMPVVDMQSGQADLGLSSIDFVDNIILSKGVEYTPLQPALRYSFSSSVSMNSQLMTLLDSGATDFKVQLKSGSFSTVMPSVQYRKRRNKFQFGVNALGVYTKGDYPYQYSNGSIEEGLVRENGKVLKGSLNTNFQWELSKVTNLLVELSLLQSDRQLPGAVIDYTETLKLRESLADQVYSNRINLTTAFGKDVKFSFKNQLSQASQEYYNPDYQNSAGELTLENTQTQNFSSASFSYQPSKKFYLNYDNDFHYSSLINNSFEYGKPKRQVYYSAISSGYRLNKLFFKAHAGGLSGIDVNGETENIYQKLYPGFGLDYQPVWKLKLLFHASYQETFRLPTFSELYFGAISPRSLEPEQAKQIDFGMSYSIHSKGVLENLELRADYYQIDLKNKIIGIPTSNIYFWNYQNLGKVEHEGFEFSSAILLKRFKGIQPRVKFGYAYQLALDVSDPQSISYGKQIPYSPKNTYSYSLGFNYKTWSVYGNGIYSGEKYALSYQSEVNKIEPWQVLDLVLLKELATKKHDFTFRLEIKNVFDEQYQVIKSYPMPGRAYYFTLFYHLKK